MTTVDARGRSCPEPVMMTRDALRDGASEVEILVDNSCAMENITRFAAHQGYDTISEQRGEEYSLKLRKR